MARLDFLARALARLIHLRRAEPRLRLRLKHEPIFLKTARLGSISAQSTSTTASKFDHVAPILACTYQKA